MTKWIILLRGINVSGQKKIIMSELRVHLASLGYQNVQTYIQSGNILIDVKDKASQEEIESEINDLIQKQYGYQVDVFAFEPAWLETKALANPFLKIPEIDKKQLSLTILSETPTKENIRRLASFNTTPDEYYILDEVMYIRYINGAGKSKLTNNLIESKLKLKATSRNLNTTFKLLDLSANI